jgi:hypothetical protein
MWLEALSPERADLVMVRGPLVEPASAPVQPLVTSAGANYISSQGTNLRLTVKAVKKVDVSFEVERRIVDRKTGELTIETRERTVPKELWRHVISAYEQA